MGQLRLRSNLVGRRNTWESPKMRVPATSLQLGRGVGIHAFTFPWRPCRPEGSETVRCHRAGEVGGGHGRRPIVTAVCLPRVLPA